jgi:hypothetical protein
MGEREPGELAIDSFDLHCDLTIRPRRLGEQMKDKADTAIGCDDLEQVKAVIREGRTRWAGHTDVQVALSALRVYEAKLQEAQGRRPPRPLMRSAVIGAGYMGARIASELLIGGHDVFVFDIAGAAVVEQAVGRALDDAVSSGYLGSVMEAKAARAAAMSRLHAAASIADAVNDVRLVCECVADNLAVKGQVYPEIVANCRTDAVFGSSTMNLPLEAVQEVVPAPWRKRVIGLRFLAPVLGVSLVEITHVNQNSRAEVKEVLDFMVDLGKTVVDGPAEAVRPQPYIGPGYETHTDMMSAGVTDADLAHFPLRPKASKMVLEAINTGKAVLVD